MADLPDLVAARGRPTGRGRPSGPYVHAVPVTDRTRTALCGERVGGLARPWREAGGTCPECRALAERVVVRELPSAG